MIHFEMRAGTIVPATEKTLFKRVLHDSVEVRAYEQLMNDPIIKKYVPLYKGPKERNGESKFYLGIFILNQYHFISAFIEIEDLSQNFKYPAMMDIKIGCR
jgi:hypothetical protein